jgi:hypothetical protein
MSEEGSMKPVFKSLGRGVWVSDALNASITIDEDYGKTYRAYMSRDRDTPNDDVCRNANGNVIRFRTIEAAGREIIKRRRGW